MQIVTAVARPSRRFVNWALCWLVLANLPFWAIGLVVGPPRTAEIVIIGIVGLIVRRAHFFVRYFVFVALLAGSTISFISGLVNLPIRGLVYSIGFLIELRPAASPEYIAGVALLALTAVLAWPAMRLRQDFEAPAGVLAAGSLAFAVAGADSWAAADNRGSYNRFAPADAPFTSAVAQSGLRARGNHLLVVVVEAMGVPRDPVLAARLVQRWQTPRMTARYAIRTGTTPFYGSTTSAEIRELCGRWGQYDTLVRAPDARCLPARLAARGYGTTALHSFDGSLFERDAWYPNVGFKHLLFRKALVAQGAAPCPGVFPGACDRDIPAMIGKRLRDATGPQFIYWLTLNSHVPVPSSKTLRTNDCDSFDPTLARDSPMVCRLFVLWDETADALQRTLSDPALPPTDVLIVGDHPPPFFDRRQRSQFEPDRVPWVLLEARPRPSR